MRRFAVVFVLLMPSVVDAAPQLEFRISLHRERYLPLEPIFIKATLKNTGAEPIQVLEPSSLEAVVDAFVAQAGKEPRSVTRQAESPEKLLQTDARRMTLEPGKEISQSFEMNPFEYPPGWHAGMPPGKYSLRGYYYLYPETNGSKSELPYPVPADRRLESSEIELIVDKPTPRETAELEKLETAARGSEQSGGDLTPIRKFLKAYPNTRHRLRALQFMSGTCEKREDWQAQAVIHHEILQEEIDDVTRDIYASSEAEYYVKSGDLKRAVSILRRNRGSYYCRMLLEDLEEKNGTLPPE